MSGESIGALILWSNRTYRRRGVCLGSGRCALNRLILASLTVLALLGMVSPAVALESSIGAADFEFTAESQQVAVGDKVVWTFTDGGHSTTSVPGQAEWWDSAVRNLGETFQKTFTKPGRYRYGARRTRASCGARSWSARTP